MFLLPVCRHSSRNTHTHRVETNCSTKNGQERAYLNITPGNIVTAHHTKKHSVSNDITHTH